ncbi:hypothetical protein Rcae01_03717 [Novipirellula caenicola]|uniref:Uncharacterized protein n=1 Tax=Novipirellula caenicola TaxID=1536901 RepID=A0ABP9VU87_9BACT
MLISGGAGGLQPTATTINAAATKEVGIIIRKVDTERILELRKGWNCFTGKQRRKGLISQNPRTVNDSRSYIVDSVFFKFEGGRPQ